MKQRFPYRVKYLSPPRNYESYPLAFARSYVLKDTLFLYILFSYDILFQYLVVFHKNSIAICVLHVCDTNIYNLYRLYGSSWWTLAVSSAEELTQAYAKALGAKPTAWLYLALIHIWLSITHFMGPVPVPLGAGFCSARPHRLCTANTARALCSSTPDRRGTQSPIDYILTQWDEQFILRSSYQSPLSL